MDDIRIIRRTLGVTQIELATLLGLHQSTISRFENGTLPVDERTQLALEALMARSKPGPSKASKKPSRPFKSQSGGKTEAAAL